MPASRFLALFTLGFAALPLCDALFVQADLPRGRAAATALLLPAGLACGALLLLALRLAPGVRRSAWTARDGTALAAGLALALAPQVAPQLPGVLGGRLSFDPLWAPLGTLALIAAALPALALLLRRVHLPERGAWPLALAAWAAVGLCAGASDAWRSRAELRQRLGPRGAATAPRTPDVTLIVLDTLRAESLDGRFEGQLLMPELAGLLPAACVYPVAYSSANSTPPGHATLFTGTYPAENGTLPKGHVRLASEHRTIAEILRGLGYRTAGLTSNQRLDGRLGFAQGFEVWDDGLVVDASGRYAALRRLTLSSLVRAWGGKPLMRRLKASADGWSPTDQHDVTAFATAARADRMLRELDRRPGEPVFCFVNFIDPHFPYETRADLAAAFLPNASAPRLEAARRDVGALLPMIHELGRLLRSDAAPADAEAFERQLLWLQENYWEQCRQLDLGLGELLRALDAHGLLDPTDLLVITADHGEQLGEQGEFLHGNCLLEASVRVPFAVFGGGFASGRDARVVSVADFVPTVLHALGLPAADWPPGLAGLPLQEPDAPGRILRFESGMLRGFVQGRRKMVALDHGDHLEWLQAYDLEHDPLELRNLLGPDGPEWVRDFAAQPPIVPLRLAGVVLTEGADTDLAQLGYVDEVAPAPQ